MSSWETSGASGEWYTPKYIFDAMDVHFDLDVAHPLETQTSVPCDEYICEDSLKAHWHGFIWMNPPFGGRNGLEPWLAKFFEHGDGVALTPDRTSAPWFQKAWPLADLVLFIPKVKFIRPDGSLGKSPSNGTALWAVGERGTAALWRAERKGLGIMAKPESSLL